MNADWEFFLLWWGERAIYISGGVEVSLRQPAVSVMFLVAWKCRLAEKEICGERGLGVAHEYHVSLAFCFLLSSNEQFTVRKKRVVDKY